MLRCDELLLELLLREGTLLRDAPLLRPLLKLGFGVVVAVGRLLEVPLLRLALLRDGVLELRLRCRLLSALPRLPLLERLLDAPLLLPVLLRDELPEGPRLNPLEKPDFGVVMMVGRLVELPLLRVALPELPLLRVEVPTLLFPALLLPKLWLPAEVGLPVG